MAARRGPGSHPDDSAAADITELLRAWGQGDRAALNTLVPLVYDRLRQIARHRLRIAPGASVDTTGLVHEAYLKLANTEQLQLRDRGHFLAFASQVMRNVLTDQARARQAAKRGGMFERVTLVDDITWLADDEIDAVSSLDEALVRLQKIAPRQAQILEQRFFGGLSLEDTAVALDVSLATVKRELRSARAWLAADLAGERHFAPDA
ncbi:MAG: sigma-70 family RNA polymerase sigma factor [Gemmatimonadaceae bacterium]|nr:sigma-70 family RNA polymerase sigma factor [Gemmatimonadaceae bacterium]